MAETPPAAPATDLPSQRTDAEAEADYLVAEPLQDVMVSVIDTLEDLSKEPRLTGLPTGFTDLDSLTGGLQPGTLTVIASRPSVGRTTLLSDICRHAAIRNAAPTAVFSLEESPEDFANRILAAQARVPLWHLRGGRLDDDGWARLARHAKELAEAPLHISAPPYMTTAMLCADVHELHEEHTLQLVAVDGIQDLWPEKRNDLREREVGDAVRDLKRLARELHIPIVATAHLNRRSDQRSDRVPALDELRESGAITFVADVIVLLHREDAYDRLSPRAGEADLIVAKYRHGPTATITVAHQGHYGRFVNLPPGM
ncbi:replicative DNA helicase [Streptomyces aidingensis]|uniref:Replicative DNA helicase n=1 Tax=Streptomyces aidingensis TaxID=910347 RepID=A0A1I1UV88_9ACTN|nr:DnaB-like helicase C-terminal domain-containing protein [Streptomyces aidingensis]SFD74732.1 replicative DNA helicase [Streptomyces aidingensis]